MLPTCAQGFSAPVVRNGGFSTFGVLWVLLEVLCVWWILVLLVFFPHIHRAWVTEVCLSLDTLFGRWSAGAFLS